MTIYVCEFCGYEYNQKNGDPDNGIEEGTEFDDLPSDWVCPMCGVTKDNFEKTETDDDDTVL